MALFVAAFLTWRSGKAYHRFFVFIITTAGLHDRNVFYGEGWHECVGLLLVFIFLYSLCL